jgi:ATP-dependent DNA ligase
MAPPPLAQRIAIGLMHPTQVATPFHRGGSIYEEKVDGYRMAAMKTDDGAPLISRNGIHHSNRYRELVQTLAALSSADFLLDGEIAIYDQALVSRFESMRARPRTRWRRSRSTWRLICWN